MLHAYLDESGTHQNSTVLCVAGILFDKRRLDILNREWKKELASAKISHFHTVEQAHFTGEFKGKSPEEAKQTYIKLLEIANVNVCGSMGVFWIPEWNEVFQEEGKWHKYSPYTTCAFICMGLLLSVAQRLGHEKVQFFIEDGHEKRDELNELIEGRNDIHRKASHSFVGKDIRPIQAADIWAYEYTKRIKELLIDKNRFRKSLQSILREADPRTNRVALLDKRLLQRSFLSIR